MRWIICRRCDKAVPPERVQKHLRKKHKIYYSGDKLDSIVSDRGLMSLDSIEVVGKQTIALETAINEILTRKCIECDHYTPI